MSENPDIERLLRLKRYEQPPEGYYETFLESFKERQRSEMLRQSARGLLVERVSTWFYGVGPRYWMVAGGATTAAMAAGFFLLPELRENAEEATAQSAAQLATPDAQSVESAILEEEKKVAKKTVEVP